MFRTWTFQDLVFYKSNYVSLIFSNASFSLCLSGRFVQTAWTFHDLLSIFMSYFFKYPFSGLKLFGSCLFTLFRHILFRNLHACRFGKPTFCPSGATKHLETHTVFCDFSTFARALIFFLLALSSGTLPSTVAASVHKSEVWLPNFLR